MKLTVKTLKGSRFEVDVEPSRKVVDVKNVIEASKPELPAATMKLIHSGRVLKDDDTIESCNIEPKGFLVVIAKKPKKPAAEAASPSETPAPSSTSEALESVPSGTTPEAANLPSASSENEPPLQALRNHPMFNTLRRLVQSNPQMLQAVLIQIGQQSPDSLREINANQARFLEMMNEPVTEVPFSGTAGARLGELAQTYQSLSSGQFSALAAASGLTPEQLRNLNALQFGLEPEPIRNLRQTLLDIRNLLEEVRLDVMQRSGDLRGFQLSEEETEAVYRLAELGFDHAEAAQAFLACDKNEELAANLLMDSGQQEGSFAFGDSGAGSDSREGEGDGPVPGE